MSWASGRQTERIEDRAYSIMGIFGVNMTMVYGEGPKAFRRLQEKISKHSNDLTIFAWNPEENEQSACGLFAPSPDGLAKSKRTERHYTLFSRGA